MESLLSNGYTILSSDSSSKDCETFVNLSIKPALNLHSSYDLQDPTTFSDIPGDMVRDRLSDPSKQLDPIPVVNDGRWEKLFSDTVLLNLLDDLHGGRSNWSWLHDDNVGWIHLRFPNYTPTSLPKPICTAPERPHDGNWHVDGAHFMTHKLTSVEQSVILLPMICDVAPLGGNTLILKNSHVNIARFLHANGTSGISQRRLNEFACYLVQTASPVDFVEIAPCKAGDLLIM